MNFMKHTNLLIFQDSCSDEEIIQTKNLQIIGVSQILFDSVSPCAGKYIAFKPLWLTKIERSANKLLCRNSRDSRF